MKKIWICILLAVLMTAASLVIPYFVNKIKADNVTYSETVISDDPGSSTAGSSNFLIVEIVPYVGMGEIGYLVGDYEPINASLIKKTDATGMLGFLGNAISIYYSNVSKSITSSSVRDSGWTSVQTYAKQNGYFTYVGDGNGQFEKLSKQTVYTKSADNTGDTKFVLSGNNLPVYQDMDSWNNNTGAQNNAINYKNVNAYFVYGNTSGATLYNSTQYAPISVKKNTERTGNYDYNYDTMTFYLHKGHGKYDVLFTQDYNGKYYMLSDYEVVDDCTGEYSWELTKSNASGNGNFNSSTQEISFKYHNENDRSNCDYNWVEADATGKTNYQIEGTVGASSEKVWVLGQKVITWREYRYYVTLVNNEWIKREVLDLSNDHIDDVNVKVVTMTPEDLNKPTNQHYLEEADLFYINAKYAHNTADQYIPKYMYCYLYENYNEVGRALSNKQKVMGLYADNKLGFGTNDLTWESTMKIFNRITGVKSDGSLGGYRAAVVFDDTYYQYAVGDLNDPAYDYNLYANYRKNVSPYYKYMNGSNIEYGGFDNKPATVCNLAKLYIMLKQRKPTDFYNLFLKADAPFKITVKSPSVNDPSHYNSTSTTGSFVPPGATNYSEITATFWNENTFAPYYLDDSGKLCNPKPWEIDSRYVPNYNIDQQNVDLIQNVVSMSGGEIFSQGFISLFYGMPADALAEAQIYLNTNSSAVKFSDYIKVATDTGTGYGNATEDMTNNTNPNGTNGSNYTVYTDVLNIEPTADFTQSEINIKNMLGDYTLRITNMTSAQFNSSILDINTQYDLIYIGAGAGHFNRSGSSTVFNKGEMNGKVYISGDIVAPAFSSLSYTGNDFTTQKIGELGDFLDAGYPVVMEDSVYNLSAVQNGTRIYSFIQSSKTNYTPNCLDYEQFASNYTANPNSEHGKFMKYVAFMQKITAAFAIERPQINMDTPKTVSSVSIQPVTVNGEKVNYVYVDPVTNKLLIYFLVVAKGSVKVDSNYNSAYIYVDSNEDGIFSPSEMLNESTQNGSSKNFHGDDNLVHQYTFNMSSYNGVCHWKVEVIKQKKNADGTYVDTNIRSEITGYAAYTNRETIKVLQITDNASDTTAYSLEDAVKNGSSSSLFKKYAGYGTVPLSDYNLVFKTMMVDDFLAQYATSPYDATKDATTNKLGGYHLIILDNQTNTLNNNKGAISNIKNEIGKGLGVVFTKDAINYTRQTGEYTSISPFALFENQKTYWALMYTAASNNLNPYFCYGYKDWGYDNSLLKTLSTYKPTAATKSNEGADTQYPYKIDDTIKISSTSYIPSTSSYLQDTSVDYNMGSNIGTNPPLVGWYSLSDAKAADNTGIFSTSPNDVKNNYYLFNKGKVYYSGIQLKQADIANNDMEMKLFINTIVACYKSTGGRIVAVPPVVTINNSDLVKNVDKGEQYLYIDIDYATSSNETGNLGGSNPIKLEFKVTGATGTVSVKLNDSSGADISVVNNKIYKEGDSSVNYNLNEKSVPAGDSNVYYVLIPASVMSGVSTKNITVTASTDASSSGSSTVTLLRRSLFQLD